MSLRRMLAPALLLAVSATATAQQVQVESFVLDNGMEFLLVPRHDQPNSIAAGWLARVGSVNERPGITGISHFFEHMMFKGTNTIGTSDDAKDQEYIHRLKKVRDKLMELQVGQQYKRWAHGEIDDPWDPANDTKEMTELRAQMQSLTEQERGITVKDEFDRVYTTQGGSGMNAFTSEDVTFFFITVPSNKFELWAWMESDRLANSVFREFYSERDVVHEERRLRLESTPTGKFDEQFNSMFWLSSPYGWPVVGWPTDLNSYTREEAEAYYRTYYSPGNLVGVIVGDYEPSEIKPFLREYFGRLTPGPTPPPMVTLEVPQQAEMRMYAEGDFQAQAQVRYHTVPAAHKDAPVFEVLSGLLNGRTGRLYKAMVEGKKIASSAAVGMDPRKYGGVFSFQAEVKGDATPDDLEKAWYEVLDDLRKNPVSDHELQKVKNQSLADSYRRLQNNFFLLVQIGYSEALDRWELLNEGPKAIQAVTTDDIMRVVNQYFDATNRSVAIYTRKAGTAPEDPELAALDPQARAMVKQQLKQIMQIEDAAILRNALTQMQANAAQIPPQFKPAMDLMVKKINERIAELDAKSDN